MKPNTKDGAEANRIRNNRTLKENGWDVHSASMIRGVKIDQIHCGDAQRRELKSTTVVFRNQRNKDCSIRLKKTQKSSDGLMFKMK